MPRPKKKTAPTERRALPSDADTLEVMAIIRREAVAWRDQIVEKLQRDHGFRVLKKGSVEAKLETLNGMGSLTWSHWHVERKS